jgi:hypothetical protein
MGDFRQPSARLSYCVLVLSSFSYYHYTKSPAGSQGRKSPGKKNPAEVQKISLDIPMQICYNTHHGSKDKA